MLQFKAEPSVHASSQRNSRRSKRESIRGLNCGLSIYHVTSPDLVTLIWPGILVGAGVSVAVGAGVAVGTGVAVGVA